MNKKIMLHIIMPNQISGPNNAAKIISNSDLKQKYNFVYLEQHFHAKGKINIKLIKSLRQQIRESNPDLIHLSGLQSSGFHAVIAAKLERKKILLAIRGFTEDACKVHPVKKQIFSKIIEPLSLRLSNCFYTVCCAANSKKMLKKLYKKNKGVIYNSAPFLTFDEKKERKLYRKLLNYEDKDFLIVVSGRMVYDKGIEFILKAIEKIDDENIKFVFIGDGEYNLIIQKKYHKYIENKKINLLGHRDDVLNILSACDVFLFATLHENLSNALLEAMVVGLPIIATDVGGNPEVVENGKNGFLIPPYNVEEIIKKIIFLKNRPELIKMFSRESQGIINQKFEQNILLQKLDSLYETLIFK